MPVTVKKPEIVKAPTPAPASKCIVTIIPAVSKNAFGGGAFGGGPFGNPFASQIPGTAGLSLPVGFKVPVAKELPTTMKEIIVPPKEDKKKSGKGKKKFTIDNALTPTKQPSVENKQKVVPRVTGFASLAVETEKTKGKFAGFYSEEKDKLVSPEEKGDSDDYPPVQLDFLNNTESNPGKIITASKLKTIKEKDPNQEDNTSSFAGTSGQGVDASSTAFFPIRTKSGFHEVGDKQNSKRSQDLRKDLDMLEKKLGMSLTQF